MTPPSMEIYQAMMDDEDIYHFPSSSSLHVRYLSYRTIYRLANLYSMSRDTTHLAARYFDTWICKKDEENLDFVDAVFLCIWIAMKMNERYIIKFNDFKLNFITRCYLLLRESSSPRAKRIKCQNVLTLNSNNLLMKEEEFITLVWTLLPSTVYSFVSFILHLISKDEELNEVMDLVDFTMLFGDSLQFYPSDLACACTIVVLEEEANNESYPFLQFMHSLDYDECLSFVKRSRLLLRKSGDDDYDDEEEVKTNHQPWKPFIFEPFEENM
jgi:hypothetical protein